MTPGPDNVRPVRVRWLVAVVVVAVVGAGACSGGSATPVADLVDAPHPAPVEPASVEPAPVEVVTPFAGLDLVEQGAVLIDVRTPAEFGEVRIDGAVLIDVAAPDFDEQVRDLDPEAAYVIYCRSGNRSAVAAARMVELGVREVYDMGGIIDWQAAGLPVVAG